MHKDAEASASGPRKLSSNDTPAKTNRQKVHAGIVNGADVAEDERLRLERLTGGRRIDAIVDSDLLLAGRYGHSRLVLYESGVLVVEDDAIVKQVRLKDVASAHCRDFVGNGALEFRTTDDRRIEIIRYSKTMSDAFGELARRINESLQVSEEELEARDDEIARVSGPKGGSPTYRCPNCGYPLRNSSDACPKCASKRQTMFRLMRLMQKHWKLAAVGIMLSIVFTAVSLGPGLLVRELVDKSLRPISPQDAGEALAQRRSYLYIIVAIFLALIAIRMVTARFRIRVMGTLGELVVTDLRARLYRTLQRLSLSYYDREHTGRIMARILTDTRVVQRFVVQAVQQMFIDVLTVVGIILVLFLINWRLAAIALLPVPFVILLARIFSGRFRKIFRSVRRKYATLSASVSETISGIRVVKSFAQEDREIDVFNEKNFDVYNSRILAVRARSRFNPTVGFVMSLGVLAVWLIGGREVLIGGLTLGTLLLFITYMNQFYTPLRQLLGLTEAFQESSTAAERVFNILDMPTDVGDHDGAIALEDIRGRIEIRNISFGYSEGERVLKNINLTIAPGEMIGLVGRTGSGKSTLVSLICRFYDPTKGRVLLDGADLRDIRTRSLRSHIGMVLQDPFLFAGTIKDNIAYGRPAASQAEIIQAARAANAHDFVMNLPDGYDSDVGERGVMLSGGEKQRISIARAILKDPAILILDEATSSVDTATEALIQGAMDRLVHGRTTIAIAHRLSTLRNADRLIVMEGGEIIEQGTHDELLSCGGVYAELVRIQAEFVSAIRDD